MPAGEQSITLTTSLLLKRWSLNLRHLETPDITRTIPSISQFKNLSHSWPFVTETRCMRPRGTHVTSVFVTTPASWAQTCAFSQPVFHFSRRKDLSLPVTSHTAHPSASWLSDLFVPRAAQQGQHWHHPIKLVPVEMRLSLVCDWEVWSWRQGWKDQLKILSQVPDSFPDLFFP